MCGRYYIDIDMKEIKKIIEEAEKNIYRDSKIGEIFPSNIAPIYIQDEEAMKPILAKWGFPKWDSNGLVINARAESIENKFMFKKLYKTSRCTVPASAYFEWMDRDTGNKLKDKFIIKKPNQLMYFAGLYNVVKKDKQEQLSLFDTNDFEIYYTIITKKADTSLNHIHDRMPVIFEYNEINEWLNGKSMNEMLKDNIELTSELIKI
jgi:putative SOS response-associated peptidase YedK